MSQSGNPAKKAVKVSSAADFKKKRQGVVELPSGLFMRLRNPGGLKMFMSQGMIPNSLMGIVKKSLDGDGVKEEELIDPEKGVDPQMVDDMMKLLDNIMVQCSVEPKVHPAPEDEADRDDNLLYPDDIEDMDKMFVFQWVSGGTTDLETFRQRYSSNMASLGGGAALGLPSK